MDEDQKNIIIYRTADGNASVALLAKDGKIWLNQQQMAELFTTSKQTISYHIINILKENELTESSVVKEYLTTAADGKSYSSREWTCCKAKALSQMPKWRATQKTYMPTLMQKESSKRPSKPTPTT